MGHQTRESDSESGAAWPRIAVMGAGAVGCYFGGMLARAGAPVTLIGRAGHVEAIRTSGLLLETARFREHVRMGAAAEPSAAAGADIILLAVKTTDTESAAVALAPHVGREACVISFQNGVDNVQRVRAATGIEALPCVVYVACSMCGAGHVKLNGRGDLVLRESHGQAGRVHADTGMWRNTQSLAAMFERAAIPCRLSADIDVELWVKMIMNCAYNAISALGRARYAPMLRHAPTRELMGRVVDEAIAVARGEGVRIPDSGIHEAVFALAEKMEDATSSMAQDIARGRRTEIDSLNGYIARRGAELGIATPVNHTLTALMKLLESGVAHG